MSSGGLVIAVHGASGRVGRLLVDVAREEADVRIGALLVSESSAMLGKSLSMDEGEVPYSSDRESGAASSDVTIDFTQPEASVEMARVSAKLAKPLLIATTGHSSKDISEIERCALACPILMASNTSLGVAALIALAKEAARVLGPEYQPEIFEIHHRHKKDAPSGTALSLASALSATAGLEIVRDRVAAQGPRGASEVGISSLRAGDIVGEHTVYFAGSGERLEITHRATDRRVFARGAIRLAKLLRGKPPGLYQVADIVRL